MDIKAKVTLILFLLDLKLSNQNPPEIPPYCQQTEEHEALAHEYNMDYIKDLDEEKKKIFWEKIKISGRKVDSFINDFTTIEWLINGMELPKAPDCDQNATEEFQNLVNLPTKKPLSRTSAKKIIWSGRSKKIYEFTPTTTGDGLIHERVPRKTFYKLGQPLHKEVIVHEAPNLKKCSDSDYIKGGPICQKETKVYGFENGKACYAILVCHNNYVSGADGHCKPIELIPECNIVDEGVCNNDDMPESGCLFAMSREDHPPHVCSFDYKSDCDPVLQMGTFPFFKFSKKDKEHYADNIVFSNEQSNRLNFQSIQDKEPPSEGVSGDEYYCANHQCDTSYGTFWFSDQMSGKWVAKIDECRGDIACYGFRKMKYYGYKNFEKMDVCGACEITCGESGLDINLRDSTIKAMEVCFPSNCVFKENPGFIEFVPFPKGVPTGILPVKSKLWSETGIKKEIVTFCTVKSVCDTITCNWCVERIINYHCYDKLTWLLIILVVYIVSVIASTLFHIMKPVLYCFLCCFSCCRRMIKRGYRRTATRLTGMIQQINVQDEEAAVGEAPNQVAPNQQPIGVGRNRRMAFKIALGLMLVMIPCTEGCSQSTTMTATKVNCVIAQGGVETCTFNEVTRLAIVPNNQDTCLQLMSSTGEPMGSLVITTKALRLNCKARTMYFTRSHKMEVSAMKRCYSAGSCDADRCASTVITDKSSELPTDANNLPGFTYCQRVCGCAACGCFLCNQACLFYRTFARPLDSVVYEVDECPQWNYRLDVRVTLFQQGSSDSVELSIEPGIQKSWKDLDLTLISATPPVSPLLNAKFLTDGKKTALVWASEEGQPIEGTIGQLQCSNKITATDFSSCFLAKDVCTCRPQTDTVSCQCSDYDLRKVLLGDRLLPMTFGDYKLTNDNGIFAEISHSAVVEIQASFKNAKLSTKTDKNKCFIDNVALEGCYDCFHGAKFQFSCKTDFGEALAILNCSSFTTQTKCDGTSTSQSATISLHKPTIKDKCTAICPGGQTSFKVEGTLNYVDDTPTVDDHTIHTNSTGGGFDWPGLNNLFFFGWMRAILVVIGIIAAVVFSILTIRLIRFVLPKKKKST